MTPGQHVTPNVRLVRELGAGGMGSVWLADHLSLKTQVVVKFMLGELRNSQTARARFTREAEAAAQVKSPHVVQVFDHGLTAEGYPFIVMEHLEGRSLGDHLRDGDARPPREVASIVTQMCRGLARVHAAGILHRDIKPDNVFLIDGDGEERFFVKLLDFGIAKDVEAAMDGRTTDTKTGQIVGTPYYMSPEQVTAEKDPDTKSDLWSVGVVAFEALTGKRPFEGNSFGGIAVAIATGPLPAPTSLVPALPAGVDAWFMRACSRDRDQRYATAKELADGLREAVGIAPSLSHSGATSGPRRARDTSAAALAATVADTPREEGASTGEASVEVLAPPRPPRSLAPRLGAGALVLVVAAAGLIAWRLAPDARAVTTGASVEAPRAVEMTNSLAAAASVPLGTGGVPPGSSAAAPVGSAATAGDPAFGTAHVFTSGSAPSRGADAGPRIRGPRGPGAEGARKNAPTPSPPPSGAPVTSSPVAAPTAPATATTTKTHEIDVR